METSRRPTQRHLKASTSLANRHDLEQILEMTLLVAVVQHSGGRRTGVYPGAAAAAVLAGANANRPQPPSLPWSGDFSCCSSVRKKGGILPVMASQAAQQEIVERLLDLFTRTLDHQGTCLEKLELTHAQAKVMRGLETGDTASLSELAKRCG